MMRLIRFELYKIRSYRFFWITMGAYACALLISSRVVTADGLDPEMNLSFFFGAVSYVAHAFLCGLVITLVCNEFENRTLRQHIIDGVSREEVLIAKCILFLILTLTSCLFIFILSVSRVGFENMSQVLAPAFLMRIGQFALRTFAYLSLALMMPLFFRRLGASAGVFFLWPVFETVIGWIMKKYAVGYEEWLPTEVFSRIVSSVGSMRVESSVDSGPKVYIATTVYICLFWAIGYLKLSKSDI